jgi:hypothetical protein
MITVGIMLKKAIVVEGSRSDKLSKFVPPP